MSFLLVTVCSSTSWANLDKYKACWLSFQSYDDSGKPSHFVISDGLLWEYSQWPEFKAVILALFPFSALIRLSLWTSWPGNIQYSLENVACVKCFIKLDSYWDDAVRKPHQHTLMLSRWTALLVIYLVRVWNAEYRRSPHWVFKQSLALQMFVKFHCILYNTNPEQNMSQLPLKFHYICGWGFWMFENKKVCKNFLVKKWGVKMYVHVRWTDIGWQFQNQLCQCKLFLKKFLINLSDFV